MVVNVVQPQNVVARRSSAVGKARVASVSGTVPSSRTAVNTSRASFGTHGSARHVPLDVLEHTDDPVTVVVDLQNAAARVPGAADAASTSISLRNMSGDSGFCAGDTAFTNTRRPSSRSHRLANEGEYPPRRSAWRRRGRRPSSRSRRVRASGVAPSATGEVSRGPVSPSARRGRPGYFGNTAAAVSSATAFIAGASSTRMKPASTPWSSAACQRLRYASRSG